MIINVGSKNPNKINAVAEAFAKLEDFKNCEVRGTDVLSGVSEQPLTIDELFMGARNRARNAFVSCDLSIGIESGITPMQYARTRYVGICGCAMYTGADDDFYYGQSFGFEYPTAVIEGILKKGLDVDAAFHQAGFTENPRIGYSKGVIGFLTDNKITRKDMAKSAVEMALISYLKKEIYPEIKL